MSVIDPMSGHGTLKTTPTVWSCVKALMVFGAGVAFWAGAVVVLMRATGS